MRITYDLDKRKQNLEKHGLDFEDAAEVFAGQTVLVPDTRLDYGEDRYRSFGYLRGRMVVVVWTPRGTEDRRVISMRKCNEREQRRIGKRLGEAGRDN